MLSKESLTDESEEWSNVEPHLSLGHDNTELIQYLHNTVYRERGVKSSYGQGEPNIAKKRVVLQVCSENGTLHEHS